MIFKVLIINIKDLKEQSKYAHLNKLAQDIINQEIDIVLLQGSSQHSKSERAGKIIGSEVKEDNNCKYLVDRITSLSNDLYVYYYAFSHLEGDYEMGNSIISKYPFIEVDNRSTMRPKKVDDIINQSVPRMKIKIKDHKIDLYCVSIEEKTLKQFKNHFDNVNNYVEENEKLLLLGVEINKSYHKRGYKHIFDKGFRDFNCDDKELSNAELKKIKNHNYHLFSKTNDFMCIKNKPMFITEDDNKFLYGEIYHMKIF